MRDKGGLPAGQATSESTGSFVRGLSLFDSIMIVVGVMIGSGIFIVPAEMAREIGSPGWLVVAWIFAGALTVTGALCYGELAAMMPGAGGMYVYLREAYSPLWGFLYGWTLFTVIQTGTIAAVAIASARFLSLFLPSISESNYIWGPVRISEHYALSFSTTQAVAIVILVLIAFTNARGLEYGKFVQNFLTVIKTAALVGLIVLGFTIGRNAAAIQANFSHFWSTSAHVTKEAFDVGTPLGLVIVICVSQTGALFSADSWHDITFAGGEVRNARRTLPLCLALGTTVVIVLYVLANLAYLVVLPFADIQHAPADRVGSLMMERLFPAVGGLAMAAAIICSTMGTVNALTLAGARALYAMAKDGLFLPAASRLNKAHVPGFALLIQAVWSVLLVLPRTYDPTTGQYGNLYSNLLDYVISAALIFYILTIAGVMRLRIKWPAAERPYRTPAYPWLPIFYIVGALAIVICLLTYRTATTWPGFTIVAAGVPIYFLVRKSAPQQS
ncbi:MAG: amino acid permease [Bryobacteraceae bacterium]